MGRFEGGALIYKYPRYSEHLGCVSAGRKANASHSSTNSSVPRKMLKFASSPTKYACEMALIDALYREQDIEKHRLWYETTFGEPLCTLVDDKRVNVVLEFIECVSALGRSRFVILCLKQLRQLTASDRDPAKIHPVGSSVEEAFGRLVCEKPQKDMFELVVLEVSELERRLTDLTRDLRLLDPKIARMAERYALHSQSTS